MSGGDDRDGERRARDVAGSRDADRDGGTSGRDDRERVRDRVVRVRSKNAGPFRLTIDLFCHDGPAYEALVAGLPTARVAAVFGVEGSDVERHELAALDVVKFSLRRPVVQGAAADRDMHGAQWAVLVEDLPLGP